MCPRCRAGLLTRRPDFVNRAAALVLAAGFFFILANVFPLMTLTADYRESSMLLVGSVTGLAQEGFTVLGAMVGTFMLVAPSLVIGAMLYILIPLRHGRRLRWAVQICHAMQEARRWNMVEVYVLGVLVSLLKLEKLAALSLGVAFWAFVGLILCLASALSIIDQTELWRKLEEARP